MGAFSMAWRNVWRNGRRTLVTMGDAARSLQLSQRRAEALRQAIMDRGIAGERLIAVGRGDERPHSKDGGLRALRTGRRVALRLLVSE